MNSSSVEPNPRVTFRVCHEDEDLLVVEKPGRVVTQPGVGHQHDTLLNGLFASYADRLQNLGEARDFGLVHRLDRETSGLVVVALSPRAYDAMREQFAQRRVSKYYWAIVYKAPREPSGVIRRPIIELLRRKDRYTSRKLARVSNAGKSALTAYRTLDTSDFGALVEARPITGRLHQVRVHLDLIGCAVLGDDTYGPRSISRAAPRLALHAHRLRFEHPITGASIDLRTAFPRDLRQTLRAMRLHRPDVERGASAEGGHELGGDAIAHQEPGVGEHPPAP